MRTADNGEVPSFDNTGSGMVSDASGGATEAPFLFYAPCPMGATEEPVSLSRDKERASNFFKGVETVQIYKVPSPPPLSTRFRIRNRALPVTQGALGKGEGNKRCYGSGTACETLRSKPYTGFCALLGIKTNFSSEHSNSLLP